MSDSQGVKVRYLDASALIKLVVEEQDGYVIREFFHGNANFCTTSLCLAEALGRLKGLWKKGRYSVLVSDSASISITADGPLADAAKSEGVRVWNCVKEQVPPWA
jgi:predicted nucleic acid-binding protein